MAKAEPKSTKDTLLYAPKSGLRGLSDAGWTQITDFCEGYKHYLDTAKTERLAVWAAVEEAAGFALYKRGQALNPGDKIYWVNRGKAVALVRIGKKPLSEGIRLVAAHIDSPRLDLKPMPLYEEAELAYLKTRYYGGVRKYQWLALPLELHGVVARADGTVARVSLGAEPNDPVFVINDLLPHLADDHNKKKLSEAFGGETLNALVGHRPSGDDKESAVRLFVMEALNRKYGFTETDFLSAELSFVPALSARDVGVDASFVGGYGQDDRVCAYAALRGLIDMEEVPEHTAVCFLADKEEIGSEGVSGMQSAAFDGFIQDLCRTQEVPLLECYEKTLCLSADVCNGYDPNYPEVSEKRNTARLGYGVGLMKYTGRRGKGGASDASAELVGHVRGLLEKGQVRYQFGELGKVDQGGGGTVAVFLARRNINVLDAGVPVLSMHSPFEVVSKFDVYQMYKAGLCVYRA